MDTKKILDLNFIGITDNIYFKYTSNKNSYLRINRNNEIIFSRSKYMSDAAAENFLLSNIDLMFEKQRIKKENKPYCLKDGWVVLFGEYHKLKYLGNGNGYKIIDKIVEIKGKSIESAFNNFIKKESNKIIVLATAILCQLNINSEIKIKKLKAVWGNCTPHKDVISLSINLVFFPKEVIRYVIYHEATHYTHLNHQKEFWDLVASWCPDYKKLRKQLKSW